MHALRACAACVAEGRERAERVAGARRRLETGLARVAGVEAWPSAANFVLARARDGERLIAQLLERGIAVRPCTSFPGLGVDHFRAAVRAPAANERLLAALEEAAT